MKISKTKKKISKYLHFCVNKNFNLGIDERYFIVKNFATLSCNARAGFRICEPEKGGLFIDCTFGSGGYSNAILSFPKTKVIALDRDFTLQKYAKIKKKYKNRFSFHNLKFSELNKVINKNTKIRYYNF